MPTKSKSYGEVEREAAAYREAGHAAAAWDRGILLETLSIRKRGDKIRENAWNRPLTGINTDWVRAARPDMLIERLAFVCLAGPVAERKHLPRSPRETTHRRRIQNAETLLDYIADSSEARTEKKNKLQSRVEAMLRRPDVWASIDLLARELLKRGTLSGKETVRILEGSKGTSGTAR